MRAVLGREPRPSGIYSATWLRFQRPACELFPKSPACLPRRFIASAHSHGKLEIHIARSLSLHHEERGWCGVRGCAEQLGLVTRLWDSAGPSCHHDAASRCLQHGPVAPCCGGARPLFDEPCLPEPAQATRWSEPSRAAAEMGASRRGKPPSAHRWHRPPRVHMVAQRPCCPSPPRSIPGGMAGCPLPRATGTVPGDHESPRWVRMASLRARIAKYF